MKKDVALGIDIGGTNTAFGFIDREGNYLTEGNIPTAKHEDINDRKSTDFHVHDTISDDLFPALFLA